MENNYYYADMSRMKELPRCAVVCRSEEDIKDFFYNCKQQMPEFFSWDLQHTLNLLGTVGDGAVGFTMFTRGSSRPEKMMWCNLDWYKEGGCYKLIEMSELTSQTDIEESEISIDVLLCGLG